MKPLVAAGLLAAGLTGCRDRAPIATRDPTPIATLSTSGSKEPIAPPSAPTPSAPTASASPLVWDAHPAGHFDAAGRLCMPKATPSGACKPQLRDPDLCALPDCELRLSASTPGECCFVARFRSDAAHRCVLAAETLPPHDTRGCGAPPCPGCGALSATETTRVRATVGKACCYAVTS